jgi:hypothetical protein
VKVLVSQRSIGYLQAGSLENADIEFISALSVAIRTPDSGAGLLPAIKGLSLVLRALDDATSRPGLSDLIERLIRLHRAVSGNEDLPSHLRAIPDQSIVSSQYWLLMMFSGGGRNVDSGPVVKQLVGASFLFHMLRGKPMPAYRADQLTSMVGWPSMRLTHQKRWKLLVQTMALEPSAILGAVSHTRVESIVEFGGWLADLTREVLHCSVPKAKLDKPPPVVPLAENSEKNVVIEGDDEGDFEEGKEAAKGPLVRWCFRRSIKGWSPGATGLNGWTWLSPLELQRTAKKIVQAANGGDDLTRRLAALLLLSLATGLPLRLLLRLPFAPNGDIWYDVPNGWVEWSLDVLVSREAIPRAILRNGNEPESIVRYAIPAWAAEIIRGIESAAPTVGERLCPGLDLDSIRSRCWRLIGAETDNPRKPYFSRFAYSLGAAILEATGDSVAAAYASLDFRHLAPSELNYLCFPKVRLFDAVQKTYERLGLGAAEDIRPDGYVGSPLALRQEVYRAVVKSLAAELQRLDLGSAKSADFDAVVKIFNRRAKLVAALFTLLIGERGSCLERRTVAAVFGHPELAIIYDKETENAAERPIPLIPRLRHLLEAYLGDVQYLAKRAYREGHRRVAQRLEDLAALRRPNMSVFVLGMQMKDEGYQLAPIRACDVDEVLRVYDIERNAGRHYWLSFLAGAQFPAYLRRALAGHGTKAGQAFHSSAGLVPLAVLNELRQLFEAEATACELPSQWLSLGKYIGVAGLPTVRPPTSGQIRDAAIDAYVRKDRRNAGRGRRSFCLQSVAYYSHACAIRRAALHRVNGLHPGAVLLLTLTLNDGLYDPFLCEQAWHALTKGDATHLANTVWCELELKCGRKRIFAPLQPSMLMLNELRHTVDQIDFLAARNLLVAWLRDAAPEVVWPGTGEESFAALCGFGLQLALFELPVWIVTAEAQTLGAASISLSSLERSAFQLPLRLSDTPEKRPRQRHRARSASNLDEVLRRLNRLASLKKRHGEDRKRKRKLSQLMVLMRACFTVHFPMVDAVCEYLIAECAVRPTHGDPIVVGTMAGYLGGLRISLEKRLLIHPLEMTGNDWIEFLNELEKAAKDNKLEFDPSSIRRFARYWQSQGASVPPEIFSGANDQQTERSAWSTASTFVWKHEWTRVCTLVLGSNSLGSVHDEVCRAYLALLWIAPARANETNYLRLEDLDNEVNQIVVTSSGFAHLKGGDDSRRVIHLSREISRQLSALRARLRSISPSRKYFFFDGEDPGADTEFINMEARTSRALREVTGDPTVRRHSLRGRAECALLLNDVDQFVQAHLDARYSAASEQLPSRGGMDAWRRPTYAASEAGHHPLTAISTYLAIWPLIARQYRLEIMSQLWPGERFCQSGGIEWGHIRVLKHRAEKAKGNSLAAWDRLMRSVSFDRLGRRISSMGQLPALREDESFRPAAQGVFTPVEELGRTIWGAGLVIAGASDQLALDFSLAPQIGHVKQMACVVNRGDSKTKNFSADVLRSMREQGFSLAMSLVQVADAAILKQAAVAMIETDRVQSVTEKELLVALSALTRILPNGWGILILPELEGLPRNAIPRMRALSPDLIIKAPSRSKQARYRFTVTAPGASRTSPRAQGYATRTLVILLAVTLEQLLGAAPNVFVNHHADK